MERRIQGTRDSSLTPRGRAQAAALGLALKAELARADGATVFLRSPLGRAWETSLIVGRELGLAPAEWREDGRLAEAGYGAWEGLTWPDVERDRPNAYAEWRADPERFLPPEGESHESLVNRCSAVLSEIARSAAWTVVVGHGITGAVLRGLNLGLDARATIALEKPQSAFFRLTTGNERRIEACG